MREREGVLEGIQSFFMRGGKGGTRAPSTILFSSLLSSPLYLMFSIETRDSRERERVYDYIANDKRDAKFGRT